MTTRVLSDASCDPVRGQLMMACRSVWFFAVCAFLFASIPSAARASCGKGFVRMPPGHAGAVVEAIVTKHRKDYAQQTNPTGIPSPGCKGPECRDGGPVPYEAPLVRTKIKTRIDAALGAIDDWHDREVSGLVRDPGGAIYLFEVTPPPTPPPNGLLLLPTV